MTKRAAKKAAPAADKHQDRERLSRPRPPPGRGSGRRPPRHRSPRRRPRSRPPRRPRAPRRRRRPPRRSPPRTPARAGRVLAHALEHLVRGIVEHPDEVSVKDRALRRGLDPRGPGAPRRPRQVIGRNGRTATAFPTVILGPRGPGAARGSTSWTSTAAADLPIAGLQLSPSRPTGRHPSGVAPGWRLDASPPRLRFVEDIEVVVGRIGKPHGLRAGDHRCPHRRARASLRRWRCPGRPGRRRARPPGRSVTAREHPLAPAGPPGALRGDRRPHRRRGGPGHRPARHPEPGRRRRTRRSSTTTSWSAWRRPTDGAHRPADRPSPTVRPRTC